MSRVTPGASFSVSSNYVKSSGQFSQEELLPTIYVEGFEDINFWTSIFNMFGIKIKARSYVQESDANGKHTLIRDIRNNTIELGKFLLVALDSDYDYLLEENKDIYDKKHVFQTYSHAIENLKWHPCKLDNICRMAACSQYNEENIKDSLIEWSESIYPEFLRIIKNTPFRPDLISDLISKIDLNKENYKELKFEDFEDKSFENQLQEKGLKPSNVFLFVHGHELETRLEDVCTTVIEKISSEVKKDLENHHGENSGQHIREYFNKRSLPKTLVISDPVQCDFFIPKIQKDILSYASRTS